MSPEIEVVEKEYDIPRSHFSFRNCKGYYHYQGRFTEYVRRDHGGPALTGATAAISFEGRKVLPMPKERHIGMKFDEIAPWPVLPCEEGEKRRWEWYVAQIRINDKAFWAKEVESLDEDPSVGPEIVFSGNVLPSVGWQPVPGGPQVGVGIGPEGEKPPEPEETVKLYYFYYDTGRWDYGYRREYCCRDGRWVVTCQERSVGIFTWSARIYYERKRVKKDVEVETVAQ